MHLHQQQRGSSLLVRALVTFFFILSSLVPSVLSHDSHGHGSHGHSTHAHLHLRAAQNGTGTGSAAADAPKLKGNGTASTAAEALVAAAFEAMAVRNKLRLENPMFNKYEMAPEGSTARVAKVDAEVPSLLDSVDVSLNSTAARKRQLGKGGNGTLTPEDIEPGPNGSYKYSVPQELIDAARIVAESTPQYVSKGNHSEVAAQMRDKYSLRVNNTNAMPAEFGFERAPFAETISLGGEGIDKRAASTYWMATIQQRGSSPFAPDGYQVSKPHSLLHNQQ